MKRPCLVVVSALLALVWSDGADAQIPFFPISLCSFGGVPRDIQRYAYKSDVSDDFSGARLDDEKWYPTNPWWKGRAPSVFSEKRAKTDGHGNLLLSIAVSPTSPHEYEAGTVVSKATFLYGYFETRTTVAATAASSSFWFYREEPDVWTEIDVYENTGLERFNQTSNTNLHVFRLPAQKDVRLDSPRPIKLGFDVGRRWTVYGLNWTPSKIEFFIDGCKVRSEPNRYWHQALHAVFDMEVMVDWLGLPEAGSLPATYQIDYFRVWQP